MRISDWSSDVCSSDLMTFVSSESRNRLSLFMYAGASQKLHRTHREFNGWWRTYPGLPATPDRRGVLYTGDGTLKAKKAWTALDHFMGSQRLAHLIAMQVMHHGSNSTWHKGRSEEHTSELQSLMRISY